MSTLESQGNETGLDPALVAALEEEYRAFVDNIVVEEPRHADGPSDLHRHVGHARGRHVLRREPSGRRRRANPARSRTSAAAS